jgi:serine/threonine-protein kinase
LIQRALAKSPEDRFQTAAEFRLALLATHSGTLRYGTAAGPQAVPSVPARAETIQRKTLDPAAVEKAQKELAVYIGPLAKVIVTRAAKNARSVRELYETVAREIPSSNDRQKFLASRAVL